MKIHKFSAKTILAAWALLLFFASCEQIIDLDLKDYEVKPVVHSLFEVGEKPRVYLTKSVPYLRDLNYGTRLEFIKDATVLIRHKGQTDTLLGRQGWEYSIWEKDLPFKSDSVDAWYYKADNLIAEEGEIYFLEIFWQGKRLESQTTVPQKHIITNAWVDKEVSRFFGFTDTAYFVNATFRDLAGKDNAFTLYYEMDLTTYLYDYVYDPVLDSFLMIVYDSIPNTYFGFSSPFYLDDLDDGKEIRLRTRLDGIDMSGNRHGSAIPIRVALIIVDKPWGKFFNSLEEQWGSEGSPFTEPVIVHHNIKNGLGIFSSAIVSDEYAFVYLLE